MDKIHQSQRFLTKLVSSCQNGTVNIYLEDPGGCGPKLWLGYQVQRKEGQGISISQLKGAQSVKKLGEQEQSEIYHFVGVPRKKFGVQIDRLDKNSAVDTKKKKKNAFLHTDF